MTGQAAEPNGLCTNANPAQIFHSPNAKCRKKDAKSAKLGLANGFGCCNFCRNGLGLNGIMGIDEIIFNHHSIYDKLSICDKLIDKNYLDN